MDEKVQRAVAADTKNYSNIESAQKMLAANWPTNLYENASSNRYAVCANIGNRIKIFACYSSVQKAEDAINVAMDKHGFCNYFDLTVVDTSMWFPVPFVIDQKVQKFCNKQKDLQGIMEQYRSKLIDEQENVNNRSQSSGNAVTTPLGLYKQNVKNEAKKLVKKAFNNATIEQDVADKLMAAILDVDTGHLDKQFNNMQKKISTDIVEMNKKKMSASDSLENRILYDSKLS